MTRGETDKTWDKLGGVGTTWGESRMGDMVAKQQLDIGGGEFIFMYHMLSHQENI